MRIKHYLIGLTWLILIGFLLAQVQQAGASPQIQATPELGGNGPQVESAVSESIARDGKADFVIELSQKADLSAAYQIQDWSQRGWYVYNTLKATADRSQQDLVAVLKANGLRYESFINGNEIYVYGGTAAALKALTVRREASLIRAPRTIHLDPILEPLVGPDASTLSTVTWGIKDTGAYQFWSTFGYQGGGIVVANIDTGVQWDHPALKNSYKCASNPSDPSCWFDPANICPTAEPCDNNNHGTHTMGTMVASDDPTLKFTAGMAPAARWIACKGCESNDCSDASLNACADWLLAPGGNPDNRPQVVNNSWGDVGGNNWYATKVDAWRASGIFPAFSAGNSGPGCSTLGSPGDYQSSFSSAAHNAQRDAAYFSARGPGLFGDSPFTKPNISAPGVNICSTITGSGWSCNFSGTSMASPHTAGAAALLMSCNPSLIGKVDELTQLLQSTTDPATDDGACGIPPNPNTTYTFGYGYLDVFRAGMATCNNVGTLTGKVTSMGTALSGALLQVVTPTFTVEDTSDTAGKYSLRLPSGTYTLTATKFGYQSASLTGINIAVGGTTTKNIDLPALQSGEVSGKVVDGSGQGYPLYARLDIEGYPGSPLFTDPVTGAYSIILPVGAGDYRFTATALVPGYQTSTRAVTPSLTGNTEDFDLAIDPLHCTAPGYQLSNGLYEDFETGQIPTGWSIVDHVNGGVWAFDDPGGRGNHTGGSGGFAVIDSDHYGLSGNLTQDTELISLTMDLSKLSTVSLEFDTDLPIAKTAVADVDASIDQGTTWTNVWRRSGSAATITGPSHQTVDITGLTAGEASVLVRFHYTASYDQWWEVDNVRIGSVACTPVLGGVVTGFISDGNTARPMNGVKISSDAPATLTTLSAATPEDTTRPDGFYWLFQPVSASPQDHTLKAVGPAGYQAENQLVSVLKQAVTRVDFSLQAGYLVATPSSLSFTLLPDTIQETPVTLKNQGTLPVNYNFSETEGIWYTGVVTMPETPPLADGSLARTAGQGIQSVGPQQVTLHAFIPQTSSMISVLLLTPDSTSDTTLLTDALAIFPDLKVTSWTMGRNPTLADLKNYRVVVVGNDLKWEAAGMTAAGVGDALADYLDAGGSVVDTMFLHDFAGWQMGGKYISGGYSPFTTATQDRKSLPYQMGTVHLPNHPIMQGVTTLADSPSAIGVSHQNVGLAAGAARIVDWDDGEVFVAANQKGNVVGVNQLWFKGAYWTGDMPTLMHNVFRWLAGNELTDVTWLSETPTSGTLAAGASVTVTVRMDMTGQALGAYTAQVVAGNDTPYGDLPIPLTIRIGRNFTFLPSIHIQSR